MTRGEIIERLGLLDATRVVFLDGEGFDACIAGESDGRLVYDAEALLDALAESMGGDRMEASEWFHFNTVRTCEALGATGPLLMWRL